MFEPTYALFLATKHHRDDLDMQLIGCELTEKQVVELDNLDSKVAHLRKLSMRIGGIIAARIVDDLLEEISEVSKFTPETSGFLAAATAGQRYIRSGSR